MAAVFGILETVVASNAFAVECARADTALSGHYLLRGLMEVGSELLLKQDGRFQYMLAYGALDEYAAGCWSTNGKAVTLVASKFEANANDPMKWHRIDLSITPKGGLVRTFDGGGTGIYSR